jgi:phage shock protein B
MEETLVPITIVFIVIGIPVICGSLIAIAKILKGSGGKARGGKTEAEEAMLIQELHRGLTRLEERIESLETIILERERK